MVGSTGKIVQAEIVEILPSGLRVQLINSGRKGFIRRREIAWDRGVSAVLPRYKKGQKVSALVLDDSGGESLLLSLRQVTDPWEREKSKYTENQVVEGEVVNVRHDEVRLQIKPGIEAALSYRDAPLHSNQNLEDILSIGDKVSAIITSIDDRGRLMNVSLNYRLMDLGQKRTNWSETLKKYFGADQNPRKNEQKNIAAETVDAASDISLPGLGHLERILVVDNDQKHLKEISLTLQEEFLVPVDQAKNETEAFEKIEASLGYTLILVDYWLDDITGEELGKKILSQIPTQKIMIISTAYLDTAIEANIRGAGMFFCKKTIDEIVDNIYELLQGSLSQPSFFFPDQNEQFLTHVGLQPQAHRETNEILQDILIRLADQTKVDYCFILKLDRHKHSVVIIASEPYFSSDEIEEYQDNLYYSPVRQVIEEEEQEFSEDHIDVRYDQKYKNFFRSLDFHSCLGLPIQIPDQMTRHVLFLLDESPNGLSKNDEAGRQRIERARMAADAISVVLQRATLFYFMKKYQARYALGQLLGDLIHEAKHKLEALHSDAEELRNTVNEQPQWEDNQKRDDWFDRLSGLILRIDEDENEICKLIDSYDRQAQYKYEAVDVNGVIQKVASQLAKTAMRLKGRIMLDLAPDLPKSLGIGLQVEQIIFNLVLNALQMTSLHIDRLGEANKRLKLPVPFVLSGMVLVQTRCGGRPTDPIEIRVIDNGPGVHWNEQEEIFLEEVSRRGGAGRGLPVSRSLAERMGGNLTLLDSIMFFGSAFQVELRCFPERN